MTTAVKNDVAIAILACPVGAVPAGHWHRKTKPAAERADYYGSFPESKRGLPVNETAGASDAASSEDSESVSPHHTASPSHRSANPPQ
jgi:hypothetical protein